MASPNPKIKKLLEKVMNTYNDNLKKSFGYPNWQPQSPLLLSKVDKETAQELFNLVKSLPNQDKKVEWGGFSEHFPFGIYVFSRTVQEEELKDWESMRTLYTSEKYLDTLSQVSQELKVITEKKEGPNNKCSKNSPCQPCKDELKEKLAECKDWEVKRKEYIKSWFPFHDEEGNKVKYSETGGYNLEPCSKCNKSFEKSNSHGDINPNYTNHACSKKDNNDNKNNIERESILNYFKSKNIKSIKLENNKLVIKYNSQQTETKDVNNQELEQIKSFTTKLGKSELSLSDLEQTSNNQSNPPKSNKLLYWGLGIAGVLLIGLIAWLLVKNKEEK